MVHFKREDSGRAFGDGKPYVPHPPGAFSAVLVDIEDIGIVKAVFNGEEKSQHKIVLTWQTARKMEDGRPFSINQRYTFSLNEKSNLYRDLKAWGFTDSDLTHGFDESMLLGRTCMLNIVHVTKSGKDGKERTYANVASLMPLPEGMPPMKQRDYTRKGDRGAVPAGYEAIPDDGAPFPEA